MAEFHDGANRPCMQLVDGGVSDNIDARRVLDAFEEFFMSATVADWRRRLLIAEAQLASVPKAEAEA